MKISKSSLKEFKTEFPKFEIDDNINVEDIELSILQEGNHKAGVIKYLNTGTFDFINIENLPVDKDNQNFEYDILSLLADKFERDIVFEKSFKQEEPMSLYEIEANNESVLKSIKLQDRLFNVLTIILVLLLVSLAAISIFIK